MKSTIPNKKRGSILVIVMVIVVAVTLLVAALLRLGSFSEIETIKQLRTTQSHWLAEAGLERALSWVVASEDYRKGLPNTEPNYSAAYDELATGKYVLKVWTPTSDDVVIQSKGTATNSSLSGPVIIQLSMNYSGGIPNAYTSLGLNGPSHIHLGSDIYVDGDGYGNGTMTIESKGDNVSVDLDHVVYATEDGNPTGGTDGVNYNIGHIPDPDPPSIDPKGNFFGLLSHAEDTNNTDVVTTFDGNLSGTVYVNGDLTVNGGISGSGTLVVYGVLSFTGNNMSIDDNVKVVVSDDITIGKHTTTGNNTVLFTQENILIEQQISGGTTALIALKSVLAETKQSSLGIPAHGSNPAEPFEGVIYAGLDVNINQNSEISGAIIAGGDMNLGHSSSAGSTRIIYNPDVYENFLDIIAFGNNIITSNMVWQVVRNP